jgi:hypothetical protein
MRRSKKSYAIGSTPPLLRVRKKANPVFPVAAQGNVFVACMQMLEAEGETFFGCFLLLASVEADGIESGRVGLWGE